MYQLLNHKVPGVITLIIIGLLAGGVSVALASLTFTGTNLTGDSGVIIDTSGTISIGTSSATAINIGSPNATTTFFGNVGIGTATPTGGLDVANGSVLFSGTSGVTPSSGTGTEFIWIPAEAALRAGLVDGTQWANSNIGSESVGIGYDPLASGQYSVAIGDAATSTGYGSVSIGINTTASGYASLALGTWGNTAAGNYSAVLGGYMNVVSSTANEGVVMGRNNTVYSQNSSVLGGQSNVAGANAALGYGTWSTVLGGEGNITAGNYSIAGVNDATASGTASVAIGQYITANGSNSYVFGSGVSNSNQLNDNTNNSLAVGFDSTVPTLFVGSGNGAGTYGDVGIGTVTPSTTLQVDTPSSTILIGASGLSGCLEMGNSNGSAGINYITVLNGVLTATTTKPSICQ
jgi:hypothetical protein